MKIPTKKYSDDDLLLLSGRIRKSSYIREVQEILVKKGITRSDNYIAQVVQPKSDNTFKLYNEAVWDAIVEVLNNRKVAQQVNKQLVAMALAE